MDRTIPMTQQSEQLGLGRLEDLDYTTFGPTGQDIHDFHHTLWQVAGALWEKARQLLGYPPLELALQQCFGPSGIWFHTLAIMVQLGTISAEELFRFWNNEFRWIFNPPLHSAQEVVDKDLLTQQSHLVQLLSFVNKSMRKFPRWERLSDASFSFVSEREIMYLLKKHHNIVDLGCGAGLLVFEHWRRGGNAWGIDNNLLGRSCANKKPWTDTLLQKGRLIVDVDTISRLRRFTKPDVTLVIARPKAGTDSAS